MESTPCPLSKTDVSFVPPPSNLNKPSHPPKTSVTPLSKTFDGPNSASTIKPFRPKHLKPLGTVIPRSLEIDRKQPSSMDTDMPEPVLVPHRGGDGPHHVNPNPHPSFEHPNWKGDHPSLPRLSICLTTNIPPPSIPNQVDNTSLRSIRSPPSPNPHNPPKPSFRKERCPSSRNFNSLPFSRELPNHPPILGKGRDGYSDLS